MFLEVTVDSLTQKHETHEHQNEILCQLEFEIMDQLISHHRILLRISER